jgi:hypothetical protein
MRRLLASTAVALLLALPSLAVAQEDTLTKIKRTSAITVGYTETSAPFSSVGAGGVPQGYSIDLCLRIADSIKRDLSLSQLDVKWAKVTAENRIASVANGAVDIECGTTTKTLSRMAQVDFTLLTFLDGGSLLVTTASGIGKLTDLPGKRVAVIPTTTTERASASRSKCFSTAAESRVLTRSGRTSPISTCFPAMRICMVVRLTQFRLGLAGGSKEFPEYQELKWGNFLNKQARRVMKASIPTRPLHAAINGWSETANPALRLLLGLTGLMVFAALGTVFANFTRSAWRRNCSTASSGPTNGFTLRNTPSASRVVLSSPSKP